MNPPRSNQGFALAETRSAILPVVPQLDILRRVFVAVALAGVAGTIYAPAVGTRSAAAASHSSESINPGAVRH